MNNKVEILLGNQKNINSVNVDNYERFELTKKESRITEFNVNDVVNATEIFDDERENNSIYRIYGRIEYLSLLNGLKSSYNKLVDFFNPQKTGNTKTIFNSFDFYLVTPADSDYTNISNTNNYKRSFKVLTNKDDFEIYNAGFTNNVFGDQVYIFSFKSDIDVNNLYDVFGFPITELFLYVQYKKSGTETLSFIKWSTSTGNKSKATLDFKTLNVGDIVETNASYNINDIVEYNKNEFLQEQIDNQKFYIKTNYLDGSTTKTLEWSYNPFISFRLRYLDSVLSTAKLSNIVEDTTFFNVYRTNNPSNKINLTKSLKQNLNTTTKTISNWDSQSNTYFNFNSNTGILKFLNSGTYEINFKTQIYLSDDTDKYIAEIYLEKSNNGTTWSKISGTTRNFYDNNSIEGIILTNYFSSGQYIRVRVGLIPNPNERKVENIPDFATIIEESGKYVWRDIVRQGYIEPLSDIGVDYPFFNGKRYLFSPTVFSVVPNLSKLSFDTHANTISVFSEMSFTDDATTIEEKPITELNDIGKPCQ